MYGKNKKPTSDQLKGIDLILFDLQDVGVRFYTYLSTLHYAIESAAENNLQIVVLDRPNPNGHYIDGPVLDKKFKSFVGLHPVPIVYGMTIGEYARMINEEFLSNDTLKIIADLDIVKMENYDRSKTYDLKNRPSPNLPNSKSINLYPSLCLFEGTSISVGRGTSFPFQVFGSPSLSYDFSFIPEENFGSRNPKHKGLICFGKNLTNYKRLNEINLKWILEAYRVNEDTTSFFNSFFNKLAGNDILKQQIINGLDEKKIKKSWQKDISEFKKIRSKYILY